MDLGYSRSRSRYVHVLRGFGTLDGSGPFLVIDIVWDIDFAWASALKTHIIFNVYPIFEHYSIFNISHSISGIADLLTQYSFRAPPQLRQVQLQSTQSPLLLLSRPRVATRK
jgi:hypothetical protein